MSWALEDASGAAVKTGTSTDYVANDFSSGDSFFRIDFSAFTGTGKGFRLSVAGKDSEPFDIDAQNPYGRLAEESFDYFEDHRAPNTVFEKFLRNWTSGRIEGPFWYDAGDKGSYPTNTAIAIWALLNLYERYPEANTTLGATSIYDEVKIGAALMHQLILPGQKLAIAKLHTNVPSWGPCEPHKTGPCVSMTETKATYAMARSLAQLTRVHLKEKQPAEAKRAFELARTAFTNARTEPALCRGFEDFGGEGGIYPDNDPWALWRESGKHREPCHPGPDNIEDDSFAALVEVFLAAQAMGDPSAATLAKEVTAHKRFADISEFWWYATAATGNLSLLTLRPAGIDVAPIRSNLFRYADELVGFREGRLSRRHQGHAVEALDHRRPRRARPELALGLEPQPARRRDPARRRRRGEGARRAQDRGRRLRRCGGACARLDPRHERHGAVDGDRLRRERGRAAARLDRSRRRARQDGARSEQLDERRRSRHAEVRLAARARR